VSFDDISAFVLAYKLPTVTDEQLGTAVGALANPTDISAPGTDGTATEPAKANTWWGGLMNTLGPAVTGLVDKIKDPGLKDNLQAIADYNAGVLNEAIPTYKDIQQSIAALIASNKYSLLQNMAKMGLLRLVVTEGEIETKITFSTWNNSSSGSETSDSHKVVEKAKTVQAGGMLAIFRLKNKNKTRTITVNTAKSYQRDSSGTKVDIFGRVLIRFKTDYAPLNG
jgi:hypothetical protein